MTAEAPAREVTQADLLDYELAYERLEEALYDARAQLAAEDVGWTKLLSDPSGLSRTKLQASATQARVMAIHDPLIRRAISLRLAYVWGLGVNVSASSGEDDELPGGQDVNAVIQEFWDDQAETFSGPQACEERGRALMTDGNVFLSLPTDPGSGRVQVRKIPDSQISDILTDPEDADTPWFYKRTFSMTALQAAVTRGATGAVTTTITRTEERTVYYPALGYRPRQRVRSIDGHPVHWDNPVIHVAVNRPEGSKWGTPDLLAALPWARGYKGYLEDWSRYMKALSSIAFHASARTRAGAALTRTALTTAAEGAGSSVVLPEGSKLEAVGKTGATIDSGSGRPLAAMVAAATDLPVTMLLGDPGVTGARATAETLDRPLELVTRTRRTVEGSLITRVLNYVVEQSVKAAAGELSGTVRIHPVTGREIIELTGGQLPGVDVDWPPMEDVSIEVLVNAIAKADETNKLHPEVIARLLLSALEVDNADEELDNHRDAGGTYLPPSVNADAAVARAALDAFNRGEDPADVMR